MNKNALIDSVAEKTGLPKKDGAQLVAALIETITEALERGEKVQIAGFGTLEVRERAAREGRNPQTGETIKIAALKTPAFKAA